jgi:hypothetical protein
MKFSVTEILIYKSCRRRWILQSENGMSLTSITHVPALALGGLMHQTLEAWSNNPEIDGQDEFLKHGADLMAKADDTYKAHVGAKMSASEKGPLLDAIALGHAMTKNYIDEYKQPFPDEWEPLQMEQRIVVDIPGTEHWECNVCHNCWTKEQMAAEPLDEKIECVYGEPHGGVITWQCHQLRGTFDGMLRHRTTGRLFCLERKTWAQHPRPEKLEVDEQQRMYNWMLRQLYPTEAGGVVYDGMWKRDGSNPKHKGQLFYREVFKRNSHDLDECGEQLVGIAQEMAELIGLAKSEGVDHPRIYHNRPWMGCNCQMDRLCRTISRGEDYDYVISTFYTKRADDNLAFDDGEEEG